MKTIKKIIKKIINWLSWSDENPKYLCTICEDTGLTYLCDWDNKGEVQEWCDYCDAESVEYTIGEDGNYVVK